MNLKVNGCCCCTLRTCGLVTGWFGIVLQALSIVFNIIILMVCLYAISPNRNPGTSIELLIRFSHSIPFILLNILAHAMLIKGTRANKHRFLLPWLIYNGICMAIVGVIVAILFVASLVYIISKPALIVVAIILAGIYGLSCWIWIAIYSLYEQIRMTAVRNPLPFEESVSNPMCEKFEQ